ncbi:nitrous oxide reductase accessory protein NosL [Thioclava sp.]|uniref:nitrous oxide reductase accessory protein NosL n=1 Tax=Thioclava sp. TaxID=1933450 RepID=UPI003AA9DED0
MKSTLLAVALIALVACRDEAADLPSPTTMTAAAVGHYCQMNLLEHVGPKAQVYLAGMPQPLFFSQIRDAIAYQRLPEQSDTIRVIYVSDMGSAPSWDAPGADNWINAADAFYVLGSTRTGGMGAPEFIPFTSTTEAEKFATRYGGTVMQLDEIPDADVLTPVEIAPDTADSDELNYQKRLRALSREIGD